MILTAQQILDTCKLRSESLDLGGGHEVIVRALPAHIVDGSQKATNADAYVFVHAVIGQDGKRLFTDEQLDEVAETVSGDTLALVASKAFALSVVTDELKAAIRANWEAVRGASDGHEQIEAPRGE